MKNSAICAGLTLAVATLLSSPLQAAEGVVLRYKGRKGDKLYYEGKATMEMSQSVNNMDLDTKFDTHTSTEQEVTDVTEKGDIIARHKTLRLKMNAEFPVVGEYKYDSKSTDNDTGSQIGAILTPVNDAVSGAVVDVTTNNRGEVSKVKGLKEVMQGIIQNNPAAAQFAGGATTDEGAKMTYSEATVDFPEKALKDGDEWTKPYVLQLPQVGKLEGKVLYKYGGTTEVDGKTLHLITFTNEMAIDVDQNLNGVKVTGKMEITASEGKALFDAGRGVLVSKEGSTTISGDLNIDVNGMLIPIKQSQTQKGSYKLLDGPPKD